MKKIMLIIPILFLPSCTSSDIWGWYVIDPTTKSGWTNIQFLAGGFASTIQLSLVAALLSISLGLIIALPGMSSNYFLRSIYRVYVEFVRAIPLLPMLFWVFYGLPVVFKSLGLNIGIDAFWGAVLTLAISDSAFTAEIFRGGIQSIAIGQVEAGRSLGLSRRQTMNSIVLPQAMRAIIPPLGNDFIAILKDTSLLSVLGDLEVTQRARQFSASTFKFREGYFVLAFIYLILTLGLSLLLGVLERRMTRDDRNVRSGRGID